jgi:hypothetical protein
MLEDELERWDGVVDCGERIGHDSRRPYAGRAAAACPGRDAEASLKIEFDALERRQHDRVCTPQPRLFIALERLKDVRG